MINTKDYEIRLLDNCQEHLPTLAKLWYEEISRHWNPNTSIESATQTLITHMNDGKLPIAFVALHNDQAIGMVCLREKDGIPPDVSPWLGSLVVHPKYRGHHVGKDLINTVKKHAKHLGYDTLHLLAFDPTISSWYTKLGWQSTGSCELLGHQVTIMHIKL